MKRWMVLLVILGMMLLGATACDDEAPASAPDEGPAAPSAPRTVTDLAGRVVTVPDEVERVAAIGSGSLRLVVYAGGVESVGGVEAWENSTVKPYVLAHPGLLELPVLGAGGPDSTADAERLISVEPDVIFVAQIAGADSADRLQAATGIPVIVVSYGSLGTIDEPFFTSLDLIGTVLGTSEDAERVVEYVRDTLSDLSARTAAVPEADRPSTFVGALGFKGMHGIESTQSRYLPFDAIGANNVAGEMAQSGSVMIDAEQLLAWDPACLFIDRGGLTLVQADVKDDPAFYSGLTAVREDQVYAQLPYNTYSTNVEIALADAYYAGSVLFPKQFADVDPVEKADEISTALVGAPVYAQLVAAYGGGFGPVDIFGGE